MRLIQKTQPTTLPIDLSEAKDQLRIEITEDAFDADLTHLIKTASDWVTASCNIILGAAEYESIFESFPCGAEKFYLPGFPISEVTEIEYFDREGQFATVGAWQLQNIQAPCFIAPTPGSEWPQTREGLINAVKVKMVAGYPVVPSMAKHLIRLLVAHWFKNREAVLTGETSKEIEIAADNLMKILNVNEFVSFYR